MSRPKLLDLFCCQGGAGMGYHRAGFDVTGVDVVPQPRYPFAFVQADALAYLAERGHKYDAIHASPPCQAYTTMSNRYRGKGGTADEWPDLIGPTRELLIASGKPWILENVAGARQHMTDPITLHGGMFGLGVDRPRLFDTSFLVMIPKAPRARNPLGIYGKAPDGRRLFTRADGTTQHAARSVEQACSALRGCDWMTWDGLRECVPPQYTEFIGEQLIAHLGQVAA